MKKYLHTLLSFATFALLSTTVLAQNDYGSLAIDARNGDLYGWAINYSSYAEADRRALSECEENGGDCQVVLNFKGGCGVYVVEPGNPYLYGWGVADTKAEAQEIAMAEARAQGGSNLIVRVWGCNDNSELNESETFSPEIKGIYGFYFTKSDDEKKCFISPVFFQPAVAQRMNGTWVYTDDAESKMTPKGSKFLDAVEEHLYGYLGDLKDKAIEERNVDWKGLNEIDNNNEIISSGSYKERKEKLEAISEKIKEVMKADGYEVIEVKI